MTASRFFSWFKYTCLINSCRNWKVNISVKECFFNFLDPNLFTPPSINHTVIETLVVCNINHAYSLLAHDERNLFYWYYAIIRSSSLRCKRQRRTIGVGTFILLVPNVIEDIDKFKAVIFKWKYKYFVLSLSFFVTNKVYLIHNKLFEKNYTKISLDT